MGKKSAGILAWRKGQGNYEVMLVHPGGPFFSNKDAGAWSIPKGEIEETEDPLAAARREFAEETGREIYGLFQQLSPVKQKSGKTVYAWAVESHITVERLISDTFTMEWPPRSGRMQQFPEVDKAEWFAMEEAKVKINAAQAALIEELEEKLNEIKNREWHQL